MKTAKKSIKTVMSIKTDKAVKERASSLAREIGIPLGTILNAYLRRFASTGEIEFVAPLRPTKYLKRIIAANEHAKDKMEFNSPEALFAYLDR